MIESNFQISLQYTLVLKLEDSLYVDVNNMVQSQLPGVKTLFSNTVWGVPYAKVKSKHFFIINQKKQNKHTDLSYCFKQKLFRCLTMTQGWTSR